MPDGDALLGQIVDGRYRVDEMVGAGGHGRVYRALHLALEVPVALKVVVVDPLALEERRAADLEALVREARALMRLKHRNIVSVLDAGTLSLVEGAAPTAYIVMEWCDGRTIDALLTERGPFPLREAVAIVAAVADALAHAHAAGVVHRDVKPSNVLVVEGADATSARLVDFGIAKKVEAASAVTAGDSAETTSATSAFTLAYAAPEQITGSRTGPRTDVHALGLLFIEMVTGAPPYGTGGLRAVIDPVRPSLEGVAVEPFVRVCARAVALRPSERFPDARAFLDAFLEARRTLALTQPGVPSPPDAAGRPATRRVGLVLAVMSVVSLVLVVVSMVLWTSAPRAFPGTTAKAAPVRAPLAVRSSFCELAEDARRARLALAGFSRIRFGDDGVEAPDVAHASWAEIEAPDKGTLIVDALILRPPGDETEATRALRAVVDETAVVPDLGVAYVFDHGCLGVVKGPIANARVLRDAVANGVPDVVIGDAAGGASPLGVGAPVSHSVDRRATRLDELTASEVAARLEQLARVYDVDRHAATNEADGEWLALDFKRDGVRGRLEYVSSPGARIYVENATARHQGALHYATTSTVAVLVHGPFAADFLERMLDGLGARVVSAP